MAKKKEWNAGRLKKVRALMSMTQGELAVRLKVDRVSVGNWELGKEPTGSNLAELCRVTDKLPSYFYT